MFESTSAVQMDLDGLLTALLHIEEGWQPNAERVDQLDRLERVKAALAAVQVRVTAAFVDEEQQVAAEWRDRARSAADDSDVATWRAGRDEARRYEVSGDADRVAGRRREDRVGVAAQVALALRLSPTRGSSFVRFAGALVDDLPHVLMAMETGELSQRRAELAVQEIAILSRQQRQVVDAELGEQLTGEWGRLGDRELVRRVRAAVRRTDPRAVVERCRFAESERRVTIGPAPDTMCHLTATVPVALGVAACAALTRAADAARVSGDERSKGQVMADSLVGRLTGAETVADLSVEVQVVMTDRALLEGDDEPAHIPGYGVVPAPWARALVTHAGRGARGREPKVRAVGAPPLHPPRPGNARRDGLAPAHVRRRTSRLPDGEGRHLPRVLVRCAGETYRPRHPPRRAWSHGVGQRTGALRPWQLHQATARLAVACGGEPAAYRRDRSQAPPVLPVRGELTDSPLEPAHSLLLAG